MEKVLQTCGDARILAELVCSYSSDPNCVFHSHPDYQITEVNILVFKERTINMYMDMELTDPQRSSYP